jgi:transcriptional regulator with XRE-family HTH domain
MEKMQHPLHKPDVIRAWRKSAKLSQRDLAARIGCARCTVSRAETASRYVALDVVGLIAAALNRPLTEALNDNAAASYSHSGA